MTFCRRRSCGGSPHSACSDAVLVPCMLPQQITRACAWIFLRRCPRRWQYWKARGAHGRYWSAGCPCRFFLSFRTQRLPPAMRGSLWPSYAGHCCLDWSDFWKLSMASSCRILPAFDLQSSTMRGSLWPFYVDRIHPSCLQRSWKLSVAFSHRVLNICKLGLIISL